MSKKLTLSQIQAKFYDKNPPVVPWPNLISNYGFNKSYRPKEIHWKQVLDKLNIKPSDRVLDIGCGQGNFLSRIVKQYKCSGIGVDISERSVKYANNHYRNRRLKFMRSDALNINLKSNSFDKVISCDLLEHVVDKDRVLSEMVRVSKYEGKLLIHAVNKNDRFTLDWLWEKLGIDIYSRALHDRNLFVDPKLTRKRLEELGINVEEIRYYDAFFTLMFDESIIVLVSVLQKLGLGKNRIVGRVFFNSMNVVSRLLYPLVIFLDKPWLSKGVSVGVTIIGTKKSR
jgi:ubiquinone/menaquinone biosynthesis C-methylase UbiE